MNKEIENSELTNTYFKTLRLISPKYAVSIGVNAESPIFVSPYVSEQTLCGQCKSNWGPIVYQGGEEVHPHHFHFWIATLAGIEQQMAYGGIFFHSDTEVFFGNHDWIASINLLGKRVGQQAESVFVNEIKAKCQCCYKISTEGYLTESIYGDGDLRPICKSCADTKGNIRTLFEFKTSESGAILFSNL